MGVIDGPLSYAQEKYGCGIEMMATSSKSLRERLYHAAIEVGPALLKTDDIPDYVVARMRAVWSRLTSVGGEIDRTLVALSDGEVCRLARDFVHVGIDLDHEYRIAREREVEERGRASARRVG